MDTKLKNWIRSGYLKIIAYVLILGCAASGLFYVKNNLEKINSDSFAQKTYLDSWRFEEDLRGFSELVIYSNLYYENSEKIKAGKCITPEELHNKKLDNYYSKRDEIYNNNSYQTDYYASEYNTTENNMTDEQLMEEYYIKNKKELEEIKEEIIKEQIVKLQISKRELNENTQFVYDLVDIDKKDTLKAKKKEYEAYQFYMYITNDDMNSNFSKVKNSLYSSINQINKLDGKKAVFIGMADEKLNEIQEKWDQERKQTENILSNLFGRIFVILIAGMYLICVTGNTKNNSKKLYPIDQIWSEVQLVVGFSCIFFITVFLNAVYSVSSYTNSVSNFIIVGILVLGMLLLMLILSQVRKIKAKRFLTGFISIALLKKACEILIAVWRKGKLSKRAVLLAIVLPILCATWIGAPFVIAFSIYMIYKYMNDFIEICEGTKKIRDGELRHQIVVKDNEGQLSQLAEDINQISQGLDNAVSNELRSERLKAELISNVSHDLKTPLTSIVTYVDLLKKEELESETANDYIDVIDKKAKRLTELTNDLFEAAKASSGDMPVTLERVDLNAIIRQGLGEFDERLTESSLDIRLSLMEEAAYIKADGRLTWRVFDNLLSNIVKYALKESRVYINVEEEKNCILFSIKNISAYELNIPANELMERFKRGDESRNSEGSGLGLSIANSLVELQHGTFTISIDGDLFKVEIRMPKWENKNLTKLN